MKELLKYFLIVLCAFSLLGCKNKDQESDSIPGPAEVADTTDNIENKEDNAQDSETEGQTPDTPDEYEPVTGDNLAVAAEFARDLLEENFARLEQSYQYDNNMKAAITTDDTKKTVLFNNSEYGRFKDMNEVYALSVGAYQYVMVPVECSVNNFNYQIAFDGNHNIVGFKYGEYATKKPAEDNTIPAGVSETEYSFASDGFILPGTLTVPEEERDFPVVILVHGFGPSDRDESIYGNKPFRDIAWALAREGIASYRYDKRSYLYEGRVSGNTAVTIEDEVIHDVIAAAAMVKNLENVDSSRIYILGHSLGGYAIPRIAEEYAGIAGYILMAAPAQHVKEYILDQYEFLAGEDETVTEEEQKELNNIKSEVSLLDKPEKIPENKLLLGAYKDYWVDLAGYNPIKTAEKITAPVLVLQGERDYQVTMNQFNLWRENFKDANNWFFRSYASLNHFMITGAGLPDSSEYRKKSHVDELVTQDIIQFIKDDLNH